MQRCYAIGNRCNRGRAFPLIVKRAKGSHGRGWWQKYQREGPEGFVRYKAPTPFNFEEADADTIAQRSRCFFEITVDDQEAGRIEFELVDELLPVTCTNFKLLCSGLAPSGFSYVGSKFARHIIKDVAILGGDVDFPGGSHSGFRGSRYFGDEGFFIPHSAGGIISMANAGVDTNGSQFYVTLDNAPHMDGRCVAFGRVVSGFDFITSINANVFCRKGKPVQSILIADCGVIHPGLSQQRRPHDDPQPTSAKVDSQAA